MNDQPAESPSTDEVAPKGPQYLGVAAEPTYGQTDQVAIEPDAVQNEPAISWQASEYVHHHKGAGWYLILSVAEIVLLGLAFLAHIWFGMPVILLAGIAVAVYAHKPPRILSYGLDDHSVIIESKTYPYKNFHSFAVIEDAEWHSIDLEPTQRFMPRLTLLFSDPDLPLIVEHLSLHLPRTDRQPDLVERFTRFIRF